MTVNGNRILVQVRLYSVLRHRDGRIVNSLQLALPVNSRLQDVLDALEIDPRLEPLLTLDDELAPVDAVLRDGDQVAIIPAVAGGSGKSGLAAC